MLHTYVSHRPHFHQSQVDLALEHEVIIRVGSKVTKVNEFEASVIEWDTFAT